MLIAFPLLSLVFGMIEGGEGEDECVCVYGEDKRKCHEKRHVPRPTKIPASATSSYIPMYHPVRGESLVSSYLTFFCGYTCTEGRSPLLSSSSFPTRIFLRHSVWACGGRIKEGKRPIGLLRSEEQQKKKKHAR